MVLSPDGRFAAVSRTSTAATLDFLRGFRAGDAGDAEGKKGARDTMPRALRREIAVIDLEGRTPTMAVPADVQLWPVQTPLGFVTTTSRPLALSQDAKRLAMERQELVQPEGKPPSLQARIVVLDLTATHPLLEIPPAPLPSPIDFSAQSAFTPWGAAFSPSGRRLVTEETRPSCRMKLVSHPMTRLQMQVPSCPDLTTRLASWDLADGKPLGEVTYERVPPQAQAGMVPLPGTPPRRPALLAMQDEHTVLRSVVEWSAEATSNGAASVTIGWTEERIALDDQRDSLAEQACQRLPPALRTIAAAEWAQRLPGEDQRAICGGR
ncbi:MAG: hypothetical protein ACRES8_03305 [Nevskiaceae bacterium]